jgi:DNA invertase Pin-like site-specific DNA recombinase
LKIIAYMRVSTQKQARSGLGMDAQRETIEGFARERSGRVLATYTETESGTNNERPQLAKALHHAKVTGATLVIAKLDRLSRNAAFLLTLRDSGARFIAADVPDANDLTVGVLALVAQQEREATSKRTKDALAAAKRRGVKLGNPNGGKALRRARKGNRAAVAEVRRLANSHAENLRPVLDELTREGITSLGDIAQALTERGMLTPRGGQWYKTSVRNLMGRLRAEVSVPSREFL